MRRCFVHGCGAVISSLRVECEDCEAAEPPAARRRRLRHRFGDYAGPFVRHDLLSGRWAGAADRVLVGYKENHGAKMWCYVDVRPRPRGLLARVVEAIGRFFFPAGEAPA